MNYFYIFYYYIFWSLFTVTDLLIWYSYRPSAFCTGKCSCVLILCEGINVTISVLRGMLLCTFYSYLSCKFNWASFHLRTNCSFSHLVHFSVLVAKSLSAGIICSPMWIKPYHSPKILYFSPGMILIWTFKGKWWWKKLVTSQAIQPLHWWEQR